MTCIVGLVGSDGKVYIGGDSAGVSGWAITPRADAKVFKRGEWVFGFTTSFRMGQLIRYALTLPDPPPEPKHLEGWIATTFVDALRRTLKDGGYATVNNNAESGGTFLLGLRGRLFMVDSDFQVGESRDGYDAVGCGRDEARGALHVITRMHWSDRAKVVGALKASAYLNGGVAGPFKVVAA